MNYQRVYDAIVHKYRLRPPLPTEYSEVHHVVPRCLGGSDDLSNLVALPAREHFVVHQLLAKIHGGKLVHAAWRMSNFKRYGARKYAWLKRLEAERQSKVDRRGAKNPMYGKRGPECPHFGKKFPERGKKIAIALTGQIMSEETKAKISSACKGRRDSDEARLRKSRAHTGRKRGPISEATRQKLSAAATGRKLSEETRAKMRGPRRPYRRTA